MKLFIIYGFRDRDIVVKSGKFDCPSCHKRKFCKHRKIESWLTVFLIPICPWKVRAEYCQCDDCRRSFEKPTFRRFSQPAAISGATCGRNSNRVHRSNR